MIEPRPLAVAGLAASALLAAGCACGPCGDPIIEQSQPADDTQAAAPEPITVHEWDRWRIAGQPMPSDYALQAQDGTALVVNLRTQEEIDRLDFDPAAEAEARGMRYVHLPMGGDIGYDATQVDAFAAAIDGVDGPVLVHCASGGRARHLWAAYLVEHEGLPVGEAMLRMEEVGGNPALMERLLGHRLNYTIGEPLPATPDDDG
ncbi:MAG: sulfur transferase domain-containing protein [Planctomycetota bacterium]